LFFSVLQKESSVLFRYFFKVFCTPSKQKECSVLFKRAEKNEKNGTSFVKEWTILFKRTEINRKNQKEWKERNVLFQRTEKNGMFFSKEQKRTECSFEKNGKEQNVLIKRTGKNGTFF